MNFRDAFIDEIEKTADLSQLRKGMEAVDPRSAKWYGTSFGSAKSVGKWGEKLKGKLRTDPFSTTVPGRVAKAVTHIPRGLSFIGKRIVQGLKRGAKGGAKGVVAGARAVGRRFL